MKLKIHKIIIKKKLLINNTKKKGGKETIYAMCYARIYFPHYLRNYKTHFDKHCIFNGDSCNSDPNRIILKIIVIIVFKKWKLNYLIRLCAIQPTRHLEEEINKNQGICTTPRERGWSTFRKSCLSF